jgi:hypothetical protein
MSDPRPQLSFTVADLNTRGELQLKQVYGYGQLEQIPGAGELIGIFSSNLYRTPEGFETRLPPEGGNQPGLPVAVFVGDGGGGFGADGGAAGVGEPGGFGDQ